MANLEFVNQRVAVGSLEVVGAQGPLLVKQIDSTALKAALTGASVALATFAEGDTVLDVIFQPTTATGSACTVDIGTDATFDGTGDANAFIAAADANTTTTVRMTTTTATAGIGGVRCAAAGGAVKIISSADKTASSFVGRAYIVYMATTKTTY